MGDDANPTDAGAGGGRNGDGSAAPEPHYMREGAVRGHYNRFCVNGDFFRPGKRVLFNAKHFRDLPHFYDHLTLALQPRFGAVRRVCTPNLGHRLRCLEDLRPDQVYVVAGAGKFVHYGYKDIDPSRKKSPPRSYDFTEPSRRYQVSGKHRKIHTQATMFRCCANGKALEGSRIVLLPSYRNRPENVQAVVNLVSGIMADKCGGAVDKLFLPTGVKVMAMDQIEHNGLYIAAKQNDHFKPGPYRESSEPNLHFSPNLPRKKLSPIPRSNKTSSHSSPDQSMTSRNGYRRDRERARRGEDQYGAPRPTKHKGSSEKQRQLDDDHDSKGVFKSKSQNRHTRGAREVPDSRHTHTDLPVDQRVAETVQDEELDFDEDNWKDDPTSKPPPAKEPERTYRTNARQNNSPSNEQARREKEREAQARREAQDRARAEKRQQEQEAVRRRKQEREEQRKRQEEEERRKRDEAEEKRKAEKERERRRKEEEERRKAEEREREAEEERRRAEEKRRQEEENAAAAPRTSTPERYQDQNSRQSPQTSPTPLERSGTGTVQDQQQNEAEQEEWAATKIQAGFRGYRERRDLKQRRGEEEEVKGGRDSASRDAEPIPVQGEEDWGLSAAPDNNDNDDDRGEQERAATKIQAGFRGAKARRQVQAMREEHDQTEVKDRRETTPTGRPVSKDPSKTRTVSPDPNARPDNDGPDPTGDNPDDNEISQSDAEHAAATKIQAAFRGQQTRKELAETRAAAERERGDGVEGGEGSRSPQ